MLSRSTILRCRGRLVAAALGAALWSAPVSATAPLPALAPSDLAQAAGVDEGVNDPLEPLNRAIFEVNEFLYAMFLRPASEFYTAFVPPVFRRAVGNVLDNLRAPVVLANDLLQGEGQRAWQTTQRFVVNSTYGIGGLVDRAEEMGISKHKEDFGQTLAVWGVGEWFYVVVPILGPSSPRDAVGKYFVDGFFDPLGLWLDNTDRDGLSWTRTSVDGVDSYAGVRDDLAQVKKTSIDYYAAIRSMYRQKRQADIRNSTERDLPPIPDINYEISATPPLE